MINMRKGGKNALRRKAPVVEYKAESKRSVRTVEGKQGC